MARYLAIASFLMAACQVEGSSSGTCPAEGGAESGDTVAGSGGSGTAPNGTVGPEPTGAAESGFFTSGGPEGSSGAVDPTGGMAGVGKPGGVWVLRDDDGQAIEAVVYPTCSTQPCSQDFGDFSYDCVSIAYAGQSRINLAYRLTDGKPQGCSVNYDEWRDVPSLFFTNDTCTGQPYTAGETRLQVDGTIYYTTPHDPYQAPATVYVWNASTQACIPLDNSNETYRLYPYKEVPSWVVELLPDAPYSLTLEY